MNKALLLLSILLMVGVLTACAPKNQAVVDHSFTTDLSGLVQDKSFAPVILYKRPDAPGLNSYKRFIIDPVQIVYNDPEMEELTPEDVARMQNYLRDAVIKELRDAGYEIGTKTQAKTMRVSFTISGLKASDAGGAANASAMAAGMAVGLPIGMYAINVGEVTVEGVFREALTNRVDAVAVTHTSGSRFMKKDFWSTWSDVEGAFDNWAEGFRRSLDRAHGR